MSIETMARAQGRVDAMLEYYVQDRADRDKFAATIQDLIATALEHRRQAVAQRDCRAVLDELNEIMGNIEQVQRIAPHLTDDEILRRIDDAVKQSAKSVERLQSSLERLKTAR